MRDTSDSDAKRARFYFVASIAWNVSFDCFRVVLRQRHSMPVVVVFDVQVARALEKEGIRHEQGKGQRLAMFHFLNEVPIRQRLRGASTEKKNRGDGKRRVRGTPPELLRETREDLGIFACPPRAS